MFDLVFYSLNQIQHPRGVACVANEDPLVGGRETTLEAGNKLAPGGEASISCLSFTTAHSVCDPDSAMGIMQTLCAARGVRKIKACGLLDLPDNFFEQVVLLEPLQKTSLAIAGSAIARKERGMQVGPLQCGHSRT